MIKFYKIGLWIGVAGVLVGVAFLLFGCATSKKSHCPVAVIEVREANGGYLKGTSG